MRNESSKKKTILDSLASNKKYSFEKMFFVFSRTVSCPLSQTFQSGNCFFSSSVVYISFDPEWIEDHVYSGRTPTKV